MNFLLLINFMLMVSVPNDFSITYEYVAGSMPPPYHYEYTINFKADGVGEIIYIPDYPGKGIPVWKLDFKIESQKILEIYNQLLDAKFFKKKWTPQKEHPVGGSLIYFQATANGKTVQLPAFAKDRELMQAVFDLVRAAVPKEIMDDLNKRRENYENDFLEKKNK